MPPQVRKVLVSILLNPDSVSSHLFKEVVTAAKQTDSLLWFADIVTNWSSHSVADLEKVLKLLEVQDPSDLETWYTRYVLLLWLSIIVMIPFHMSRIDGFAECDGVDRKTIIERILDVCKRYIMARDSCKSAAIFLASRFFIRADVKQEHLGSFFDWCCEKNNDTSLSWRGLEPVASLLKHGGREDLLPFTPKLLQWVVDSGFRSSGEALARKFSIKVVQRIGLTFLKPRVATWRYQRGNRSLAANLNQNAGDGELLSPSSEDCDQDDDVEVPAEIEDVVGELIGGLRDCDTRVRYSAAKGLGRLSARLPLDMADEILATVLELFSPGEPDGAWHGASLALAELGRRGLLLPSRLPDVVAAVLRGLDYDDVRAHNFAVGASVRDAACYVAWSLARAFEPPILRPHVQTIASALLCVAVFDREINCRRAASAAFQENVGRQGTFPHGIEIVTIADYFALGSRNNSFLKISYFVAGFEEYRRPLINHLVERKINHWDASVRDLSAKALGVLTKRDPYYISSDVLPKVMKRFTSSHLDWRHGAVLSLAEVVLALSDCCSGEDSIALGAGVLEGVQEVVIKAKNCGYFRGIGGELMWCAVLKLIENSSLAHLPLHSLPVIAQWSESLEECLVHKEASVRERAAPTLAAFLTEYMKDSKEQCTQLVQRLIKGLGGSRIEKVGSSLAVGAMPAFAFQGLVPQVVSALAACATCYSPPETVAWADCRKTALKSLSTLASTLKLSPNDSSDDDQLKEEHAVLMYNCLLKGMEDYTADGTGDIGAWVREASMDGLVVLTQVVVSTKPSILTEELVGEMFSRILQQCVEPIGRLENCAIKALGALLCMDPPVPNIPHRMELIDAIPKEGPTGLTHYTETESFSRLVTLVSLPRYTYRLILGLICSIGSLTESLAKKSIESLASHLQTLPFGTLKKICDELVKVADDHSNSQRLSLPILRSFEQIIGSGAISPVLLAPVDEENQESMSSSLPSQILRIVRKEMLNNPTVYKRMAAAGVLCQLLQAGIPPDVSKKCLSLLAVLLGCGASRARTATAALLYEALLVAGEESFGASVDEALSLLAETDWASPNMSAVRESRNAFCQHLGLPIPRSAAAGPKPS
ncbi:tubulin-specific chaperone D isoform X2 [Ischnura elegans]|uniref:tubulin-specific chaperone D isoform X2 n=1 Tax=Ischnura elegans TaxID=197161 RepID=UPI001ED88A0D|nr:tubulin-specific chaperone D isoform X2 [Ischnura elegans]